MNHLPQYPINPRAPEQEKIGTYGRWERLIARSAPGKSSILRYAFTGTPIQPGPVSNLEVSRSEGGDMDAENIYLTLSRPLVTPNGFTIPADIQNVSGLVDNEASANTTAFARPFADIEWGVGGINNKARVDILNGAVANLVASWMRVSVGVESNVDTGSQLYQLAAFVGPGVAKNTGCQRTIQIDSYAAGVSDVIPVPKFAKQFWILTNNGNLGTLAFFGNKGATVASTVATPTAAYPGPWPVPNGAYFMQYTPTAGTPRVNVVFDLSI